MRYRALSARRRIHPVVPGAGSGRSGAPAGPFGDHEDAQRLRRYARQGGGVQVVYCHEARSKIRNVYARRVEMFRALIGDVSDRTAENIESRLMKVNAAPCEILATSDGYLQRSVCCRASACVQQGTDYADLEPHQTLARYLTGRHPLEPDHSEGCLTEDRLKRCLGMRA